MLFPLIQNYYLKHHKFPKDFGAIPGELIQLWKTAPFARAGFHPHSTINQYSIP